MLRFALLLILAATAAAQRRLLQQQQNSVFCQITVIDDQLTIENGTSWSDPQESIVCVPSSDPNLMLSVALPDDIVTSNMEDMHTGRLYVEIEDAVIFNDSEIMLGPQASFQVVPMQQSRSSTFASPSPQTVSVAIFRVFGKSQSPTVTRSELARVLDPNGMNLMTQYHDCSNGMLNFVSKGVHDVRLSSIDFKTMTPQNIAVQADKKFLQDYGDDSMKSGADFADHILYCMPEETAAGNSYIARAAGNSHRSWYRNTWCYSLSAAMHEIGHNRGVTHASANGQSLGDQEGMMGYSNSQSAFPSKCFNAMNTYKWNWFGDRTVEWNSRTTQRIPIVAKPHASFTDDNLLIAVDDSIYMNYNLATGINKDTNSATRDHLTITMKDANGGNTQRQAALSVGESWRSPSGAFIKACELVGDIMYVGVGRNANVCSAPILGQGGGGGNDETEEEHEHNNDDGPAVPEEEEGSCGSSCFGGGGK